MALMFQGEGAVQRRNAEPLQIALKHDYRRIDVIFYAYIFKKCNSKHVRECVMEHETSQNPDYLTPATC